MCTGTQGDDINGKIAAVFKPITSKVSKAGKEMLAAAWRDLQATNGFRTFSLRSYIFLLSNNFSNFVEENDGL